MRTGTLNLRSRHWAFGIVLGVLNICGCVSPTANLALVSEPPSTKVKPSIQTAPARVTNRPGNTNGKVMILEYHSISLKEARWDRSVSKFKQDLERLYKMGFRPVTVTEYLTNKMTIPPGSSPVVFTFDDANPSQFRYLKDGSIDPNCAVGIMKEFADRHPDFPVKATWYVLPVMFWQPESVKKKVDQLHAWGSELASHTITHPRLKSLTDEQVKSELVRSFSNLSALGEKLPVSLALPFGILPRNTALLKGFSYKGKSYTVTGVMMAGAAPAPAPTDKKLNIYRIPRVQGIDGDYGIKYYLDKFEKGAMKPYVMP